MSVDLSLSDDLLELAAEATELGRAAAADRPLREDSWVIGFDREFSLELGRRGWLGMTWPTAAGGHGRSAMERFVVTEALIATGAPLAATWVGDRQIGPTLIAYGTRAQQARFVPDMVRGSVTWSIGMSEPDAGSDLASLRTRTRRDGDDWVLDGRKIWTSFGQEADHCYVVARTDPTAPSHAGLSDFLVDLDTPGVSVTAIEDMTGARHFCEVVFDGVRVPGDRLVGVPDQSWKQLMRQLDHERGGIDRLVSNRALFCDALAAMDTEDVVLRQRAARLEAESRIGRMLVLRETTGAAPAGYSAVTKIFCTELQQRIAAFVLDCDPSGSVLDGRAARAWCYAPAYAIQGGGNAVLRDVIAQRLLGLPR